MTTEAWNDNSIEWISYSRIFRKASGEPCPKTPTRQQPEEKMETTDLEVWLKGARLRTANEGEGSCVCGGDLAGSDECGLNGHSTTLVNLLAALNFLD